jgi:hypothetical protein
MLLPVGAEQIIYTFIILSDSRTGMADEDVRVESAAGELISGISRSSATMMDAAYLPVTSKRNVSGTSFFKTVNNVREEEIPGPDGRVYITKLSNRTPEAEIKRIRGISGEQVKKYDFYTVIFYINVQLDEPSTTRFINATVSFISSPQSKILKFSPEEKEIMAGIVETAGERIFLSPTLEFSASPPGYSDSIPDDPESRFEVFVGLEEKMWVTYRRKYGYSFLIPKDEVLEYEGVRKNDHEVLFEIYPPMPPRDSEISGIGKHAIVSIIVQVPRFSSPGIVVRVAGKVKGEIWGVVPLTGQVKFSTPHGNGWPPG